MVFYSYTSWYIGEQASGSLDLNVMKVMGIYIYPKASLRRGSTLGFTAVKVTALENAGHIFIFHLPNLTGELLMSRLTGNHTGKQSQADVIPGFFHAGGRRP